MTPIDGRIFSFLVWGLGVIIVSAIVLLKRWRRFVNHRYDRRKSVRAEVRKDVMAGVALFLTSLGAGGATTLVLFGEPGTTLRTFFIALALGAFFGSLVVMATEEDSNGDAVREGDPRDRA